MQLWTFLHILSMFVAVTITAGGALFAAWAVSRRDLDALRVYYRLRPLVDSVGGLFFLAGIAFGVIAAIVIGLDLFTSWLIVAYVLVVLLVIVGAAMGPYLTRVGAALDAADAGEGSAELDELLEQPNVILGAAILLLLIALIIWDMVFKPTI